MLALLFLATLAGAAKAPDTPQDTAKGAALLRGCQAELRITQPDALQTAGQPDLIDGTYCVGYVTGFVANLAQRGPTVCAENLPMVQLVRAYVAYMERNPRLLDDDKRVGLRLALESSFPCPALTDGGNPHPPLRRNRL